MSKRLSVHLKPKPAMKVSRVSIGNKRLVYIIVVPKAIKCLWGRSRIVYIGTTGKGVRRIALSAAHRAKAVLGLRGVREFEVRVVTCPPRPGVGTWVKLERALLLAFRHMYGRFPFCNKAGRNSKVRDEFDYFRRDRLERLLRSLE